MLVCSDGGARAVCIFVRCVESCTYVRMLLQCVYMEHVVATNNLTQSMGLSPLTRTLWLESLSRFRSQHQQQQQQSQTPQPASGAGGGDPVEGSGAGGVGGVGGPSVASGELALSELEARSIGVRVFETEDNTHAGGVRGSRSSVASGVGGGGGAGAGGTGVGVRRSGIRRSGLRRSGRADDVDPTFDGYGVRCAMNAQQEYQRPASTHAHTRTLTHIVAHTQQSQQTPHCARERTNEPYTHPQEQPKQPSHSTFWFGNDNNTNTHHVRTPSDSTYSYDELHGDLNAREGATLGTPQKEETPNT